MSLSLSGCGLALKTGHGTAQRWGIMLAVNQYLCTSAEIKRTYGVLQTPVPTRHMNSMGPALLKFVTVVSRLNLSSVHKYWFTASIIPYLCAFPCPVFIANPQPKRESDIGVLVDRLPAPVQLSGIYPTSTLALLMCQDLPGFPPQNLVLSE